MSGSDMQDASLPSLKTTEELTQSALEVHYHHHPHDHAHVDLMKDEYVPEEVALMLGTSVEVIMHAIWNGELKAERVGQRVVCIPRAALVTWYKRR
jgi:excisionase family DNA binding protein